MSYEETLHYLYAATPVFQHHGASAYKPGLDTIVALDNRLGNPHRAYRTVHVGGTNGKGSVCHTLAAIFQQAGYRTGLFTSPHLLDFRERIRVNGEMISKDYVTEFIERHRAFFEPLKPSFFELTTAMAFDYFRSEKVDIAVIEVGLGGRLDSTNIITPILSIITGISIDHAELLGDTPGEIAYEKAGIIKAGVPVVVGKSDFGTVDNVFRRQAEKMQASLLFAQTEKLLKEDPVYISVIREWIFLTEDYDVLFYNLSGPAQDENMRTVLCALRELDRVLPAKLPREAVESGVYNVCSLTGLHGRWEILIEKPYTVADTGHNPGAWEHLAPHIETFVQDDDCRVYMIVGFSKDKDVDAILGLMPKGAFYLFTQANSERALPVETLIGKARAAGLQGQGFDSVYGALAFAIDHATGSDMIFIGGSHFIVADALPLFDRDKQ
ncbi:MAG: bifunctional folylpolyglutamate synthase/dihydrofolate synthase [Tannerellaceae bacterium]|jgi:dihydrofolate synthase/folylpolyglutamate synthase|nr:bifunctional folylpolyglutamate synthase/dihydrofolate synthase [Tannerellaceae bacterium]